MTRFLPWARVGPCLSRPKGRLVGQQDLGYRSLFSFPRRAVLMWLDRVLIPRRGKGRRIPEALGLEEFRAMLEKRVEEWNRILREEGRQEGEARLLLSLLERKFGRLDAKARKRVQSADAERLLDWGARMLTAERLEDVFN